MAKKIILLLALILFTSMNVEAADNETFDELASTYVEGDSSSLTLIRMKADGTLFLVSADSTSKSVAFVPFSRNVYDFYVAPNQSPLIFDMAVMFQERGQIDDDLGIWEEDIHLVPVYALFSVQGEQIICEKPFSSASGVNPSHYQAMIQSPNHIQLIEILMTHMPRLHEQVAANGVTLP